MQVIAKDAGAFGFAQEGRACQGKFQGRTVGVHQPGEEAAIGLEIPVGFVYEVNPLDGDIVLRCLGNGAV